MFSVLMRRLVIVKRRNEEDEESYEGYEKMCNDLNTCFVINIITQTSGTTSKIKAGHTYSQIISLTKK